MKLIKFLACLVAAFLFISPVLAEEEPLKDARDRLRENVKEFRQNVRNEVKEVKVQNEAQVESLKNATREEIDKRKEEFKRLQKQQKEEFESRLEEARTKARDELETRRAELKEKLQSVRNEQKKKIVERISQQTDELNVRITNHFSQVLGRLEKVLANIVSRVDKAEANNWDVSAVRAMIESAEQALASARAAIEVQAAKNYTPQITGEEEKLKVEVGEARKALHRDLTAVREKVRAAQEFVKAVAKALAQSPRINELKAPPPTPSQPH